MKLPETKKWRLPVKESDLTEEEVRIWFTRLQKLHHSDIEHIRWLKEQRKQLNIQKNELMKEVSDQKKEIKKLEEENNKLKKEIEKSKEDNPKSKIDDYKWLSPEEIKKNFWNSL